jgi:hypothetical protein
MEQEGGRMKLKERLVGRYLPLWAKETVLRENKILMRENEMLKQKVRELDAYIDGIKLGIRHTRRAEDGK